MFSRKTCISSILFRIILNIGICRRKRPAIVIVQFQFTSSISFNTPYLSLHELLGKVCHTPRRKRSVNHTFFRECHFFFTSAEKCCLYLGKTFACSRDQKTSRINTVSKTAKFKHRNKQLPDKELLPLLHVLTKLISNFFLGFCLFSL